jgi:hypothetical protein
MDGWPAASAAEADAVRAAAVGEQPVENTAENSKELLLGDGARDAARPMAN